jgi:outer membrane lipoprotein-sorting protein
MKVLPTLFVLAAVLYSSQAFAAEIDMPTLMQLFSASKNLKADFAERKYIQILDTPVESSGELTFRAPNYLEKRTKSPRPEVLSIEGSKLSIERGTFKRTMSLDEFADMASLVQSLTATFRGDQASIETYFRWRLSGPSNRWQLVLTPKTSKLFVTLKEIRLAGDNAYVHTVETTLTDGDRSLMTLSRPIALPAQ